MPLAPLISGRIDQISSTSPGLSRLCTRTICPPLSLTTTATGLGLDLGLAGAVNFMLVGSAWCAVGRDVVVAKGTTPASCMQGLPRHKMSEPPPSICAANAFSVVALVSPSIPLPCSVILLGSLDAFPLGA
eukprot:CAMPEP_0179479826 /NCGR_PEP_ID=MMETSP0799-20121207/57979_1 /TAXON_ID=46947 /ORGANISM="Geminigera cryophila, Strain CCMP2564" /LENGTH=130 /DNA_ID=CAMNT_0021291671 /DNA_START=278 /DNA_END=667 /DNA_ORIENTATION=+